MTIRCLIAVCLMTLSVPVLADEPSDLPPDLAMVPADATVFIALHFGDHFRDGPEVKSLKELANAHPVIPLWWLRDLEKGSGLRPSEVQQTVFFMLPAGGAIGVVTSHEEYDKDKVTAAWAPEAETRVFDGKEYLYSKHTGHSLQFVDDRMFVVGSKTDLSEFFKHETLFDQTPALKHALSEAGKQPLAVVHLHQSVLMPIVAAGGRGARANPVRSLGKASGATAVFHAGENLRFTLSADFKDADLAAAGEAALAKAMPMLAGYIAMAKENFPPFFEKHAGEYPNGKLVAPRMDQALKAAATGLKAVEISTKDNRATAVVTIETDQPVSTAALLISLMPRAAKEEGE